MLKCGKSCRWSPHILSDVQARGVEGGSLLTLLFQQHRIKGCECVLSILWVLLTGIDTGALHFNLTCLRQMREGNICTSVTRSVIKKKKKKKKKGALAVVHQSGARRSRSSGNKVYVEKREMFEIQGCGDAGVCVPWLEKSLTHTQDYIWLLYHARPALQKAPDSHTWVEVKILFKDMSWLNLKRESYE